MLQNGRLYQARKEELRANPQLGSHSTFTPAPSSPSPHSHPPSALVGSGGEAPREAATSPRPTANSSHLSHPQPHPHPHPPTALPGSREGASFESTTLSLPHPCTSPFPTLVPPSPHPHSTLTPPSPFAFALSGSRREAPLESASRFSPHSALTPPTPAPHLPRTHSHPHPHPPCPLSGSRGEAPLESAAQRSQSDRHRRARRYRQG